MASSKWLLILVLAVFLVAVFPGCTGPGEDAGGDLPSAAGSPPAKAPLGEGEGGEEGLITPPALEDEGEAAVSGETDMAPEEGPIPEGTTPDQGDADLPSVTLLVTRDYGREILEDREMALPENNSVLALLESAVEVTSGYGGGFVLGINGLEATGGGWGGERRDWFYYVNGVFSPVGAADYLLTPGDVVWWDYHNWSAGPAFPALVGSYPEPFVNGFLGKGGGVVILSPAEKGDLAGVLQQSLLAAGANEVSIREPSRELLADRSLPTIILGEWEELQSSEWLAELNRNHRRAGTCVHFTGSSLELLDYRGQVAKRVEESAGVIAATGEGSGDANPLWLVAGTDGEGLERAVEVLIQEPETISGIFSGAIVGDKVIALPLL